MAEVFFPYGHEKMSFEIPDERFAGELNASLDSYEPGASEEALVLYALQHPVASPTLCDLAKGKKKITLIASDHTRPVPSRLIVPPMLQEIRKGNPNAEVTILIATGCHRKTNREELRSKFGKEIMEHEKIIVHDCDDTANLVSVGTLPSGGELVLNRLAVECDLLVSEGFIEPHFFAGFSGGRKSVLPGVASRSTVIYNHNAAFIDSPFARTGNISGNPIHEDMIFAAKKAKLAFICNVVLNSEKKVVYAAAGDVEKAHQEGCAFLKRLCGVSAPPADIVITTNGGYPLDQNIYQAVKGMNTAESLVKENGVTIMLAKSNDGHGGESFYRTFREQKDLKQMMENFLKTPPEKTIIDQWQSQIFARVMMHSTVIYISDAPDEMVKDLHMIPAHSIAEAVAYADEILFTHGVKNGKILAVPDGVSVIAKGEDG